MKGDLARSVFYFYTMYTAQANLADPGYFNLQRLTLCQWNALDPADSAELAKTWRIAPYQDGKANPFVLDCTLANRCYCPEVPPNCSVSVSDAPSTMPTFPLRVAPNPLGMNSIISLDLPMVGQLRIEVMDMQGRILGSWVDQVEQAGAYELKIGGICAPIANGSGRLRATLATPGGQFMASIGLVW